MFRKKQPKNSSPSGDDPNSKPQSLSFVKTISPFSSILQKFGPSPRTEQALADVHTIADLEGKLTQYLAVYNPSGRKQMDAAAIWLLWEACNLGYTNAAHHQDIITSLTEKVKSLNTVLGQHKHDIEFGKVSSINAQKQILTPRELTGQKKKRETD